MKKVVIIGSSGTGKSTLCNILSGCKHDDSLFPVSKEMSAGTFLTTHKKVSFVGSTEELILIDTPGLNDPEGKDSEHIKNMIATLQKEKTINCFIIVFNGECPRMDQSLQNMLLLFQNAFGEGFLKNTMVSFSRWSYDKSSVKRRQRNNQTEDSWTNELNTKLQEAGLITEKKIPTVFIDSLHDEDSEFETEIFQTETKKLLNFVLSSDTFDCSNMVAAKSAMDQMMDLVKYAEKDKDEANMDLSKAIELGNQARISNLQTSAESTKEIASNYISSLNREQATVAEILPGLINKAVTNVLAINKLLLSKNDNNIIIKELVFPINGLLESLKMSLKNVEEQKNLINEEFAFYTIREKKLKDDNMKTEEELQKARHNLENTKNEIRIAKEKIALAERGAQAAKEAVEVAKRKKDETLGVGITLTIFTLGLGAPALVAALDAAERNLQTAQNSESSQKNVVSILGDVENIWLSQCQDQDNNITQIEADIVNIRDAVRGIKNKQKDLADLMENAKKKLQIVSNLKGKGDVLQHISLGSILLEPIFDVFIDFVKYIQTNQKKFEMQTNCSNAIEDLKKTKVQIDTLDNLNMPLETIHFDSADFFLF